MIPLKYNTRNLRVRWVTTLLTVFGTGLIVWSSCLTFGLAEGLRHSQMVSGDPLDLIILRKGSTNETNGGFSSRTADEIATLSGIARDDAGKPLVAKELLDIPLVEGPGGGRTNIILRGVTPASSKLRPAFTIVKGRYLEPGKDECIVAKPVSGRFKGTELGGLLRVGDKQAYRVVGLFTSGGSAAESEIWVDIGDLRRNTNREDIVSSVQLRASSVAELESMKTTLESDTRFKLGPKRESDFYAEQTQSSMFLTYAGAVISVFLTIGAMFAAANTMFAAVRSRTREIGTMRALGFSQFDILISFMSESILLCVLGGMIGLIGTIPLNWVSVGIIDTFVDRTVSFRFGPLVLGAAFTMTLAMGVFGGIFPAVRAVRLDVIRALREL
jgi:putative ABC transport system permease protein